MFSTDSNRTTRLSNHKSHIKKVQGARGELRDFHFFIVSDSGECQLPGTLFGMKNIVPSQSYNTSFKSRKYIQLHCTHKL